MIASFIAYALCALCVFWSIAFGVQSIRNVEKNGERSFFQFVFMFAFGLMAWGFAFLAGLS